MNIARENDRVLLIAPDGKRYMLYLKPGITFHSNLGIVHHDDIIGASYGRAVLSHLGEPFIVLNMSIYDKLMRLKRRSQIIYPKEIGQILLKLDINNGKRVIEAGTGSGALTIALANAVQPGGMIYSYDCRADMQGNARRNVEQAGLMDSVTLVERDIADGFEHEDVDALFLDVREPWFYLDHVCQALTDGGFFGALVPTTNQVTELVAALQSGPFIAVEVLEIMERHYKPVPGRLRPFDTMVGHTGYLLFARKIQASARPTVVQAGAADDDAGESDTD